jgi:hypothetical protein
MKGKHRSKTGEWRGAIAPGMMNALLLEMMRREDAGRYAREAEAARALHIGRQQLHNLHHKRMHLRVPMLMRWCNGNHLDVDVLVHRAAQCLRAWRVEQARGRRQ